MAFTVTAASTQEPRAIGSRKRWAGTLTVDNSYANGTGFTVPVATFGLTSIDWADIGTEPTLTYEAAYVSGGANLVFKCIVVSTGAELANATGSGKIFPLEVVGI